MSYEKELAEYVLELEKKIADLENQVKQLEKRLCEVARINAIMDEHLNHYYL
jgi:predicted  nucleic acid-binding Zn-ribbon protein